MNDEIDRSTGYRPGPHWFAILGAIFTFPLLFVGGLVTTYKIGMAVPDWPTTFGMNMFFYDFFKAPWGVFGEHTHRLYAAAVGVFTILLMLDFFAFDRRRWMKGLGVVALVAVIAQGVLGGYRVRLNSTSLAAIHGVTAQAFFGLMVALGVLTGRGWFGKVRPVADAGKYRRLTVAALILIFGQIIVGAWLRHDPNRNALVLHSILAVLVLGHGSAMIARIGRQREQVPELVPASKAMAGLLILQIGLGVGAWWLLRPYDGTARPVTFLAAMIRTSHQANAGLLLGSAVVLTLRAFGQMTGPLEHLSPVGTKARDLETVA